MSIAYYDSIIAECDKKIAELTDSKNQVISVLPSVVSCSNNTAKVNTRFSNLVFFNEPFGSSEIANVSNVIENVESNLNFIVDECNEKISEYLSKRASAEAAKAALIAEMSRARSVNNKKE